ncbi:MAG: LacI family DNA-binding transcriptional regulator [Treponema sp.]|nr:LacI family DNA-binding transcriptional regulator [Treponema sp.]
MTVNEIAKIAGVSTGTVDRVVHNRGRVSEETRQKILKIIEENDYKPDPIARFLKKKGEFKIGVLIPFVNEESGYWQEIYDGITESCKNDYSSFGFKIVPYEFRRPDRNSLNEQYKKMIASDCAAFIIAPVMQEEILFLLSESKPSVPYCFVDTSVPGSEPLCAATQNPLSAGFLAAKITRLFAKGQGTFAAIKPFSESFNLNERSRGFEKYFEETKKGKALLKIAKGAEKEQIYEAVDSLVHDCSDLQGICIVNSEGHFVGDRISELGLKDKIAVTGFDLVPLNKEEIKEGKIDALISQDPKGQGQAVMKEIYKKIVLQSDAQKIINMPLDIYFRENVE